LIEATYGVEVNVRTLKRLLREWGCNRKDDVEAGRIDEQALRAVVVCENEGANRDAGYRLMWQTLKTKHNIYVKRWACTGASPRTFYRCY
jgi:hypothetical protein